MRLDRTRFYHYNARYHDPRNRMMKQKTDFLKNKIFLLSSVLLSVLILASCMKVNQNNPSFTTYWREYSSADIETNDFKRLQPLIPFKIVLPKYLPKELAGYHPDFSYTKDWVIPGEISLKVYYWTTESPQSISFEEFILPGLVDFLIPSYDPYNLLIIKDTEVLEETWTETLNDENSEKQSVSLYKWITNEVYFRVYIYGYDKEEARNVIESMIK